MFHCSAYDKVSMHIHNISFSETVVSIDKIDILDLITLNYA